jgi:hypothetical protein
MRQQHAVSFRDTDRVNALYMLILYTDKPVPEDTVEDSSRWSS